MPRKIAIPAAMERSSPPRAAHLINVAGGVLSSWRHRPGVLQLSICLQHSIVSIVAHRLNRCVLRDGPTPHPPSSNGQRDALSAIHPLPFTLCLKLLQLHRLLLVRSDAEEEDYEDFPLTIWTPKWCMIYSGSMEPLRTTLEQHTIV